MTFPGYLALTAAEFSVCKQLPEKPAWMACHFSCYGTGLSNVPTFLPEGAMLIVNDRTPPQGHDHLYIVQQLLHLVDRHKISCVLLDLQRPGLAENTQIAQAVANALPCPTAVSALYGKALTCPVFLPPVPVNKPLSQHLIPWEGRDIWIEVSFSCTTYTISEQKSQRKVLLEPPQEHPYIFRDEKLNCHYCMDEAADSVRFTLWREPEDVISLLQEAKQLGVTKAVGLYQELGRTFG